MTNLPDIAKEFIDELQQKPNVLGIILFGSFARGNPRPESDIDLVVILNQGYQRTVEYRGSQAFEIIYTTETSAFDYWSQNKNDAAMLWKVAKILYDKDGKIKELQQKIQDLIAKGKSPVNSLQRKQFRFDTEDQIKYVEYITKTDQTTANLVLYNKIFSLSELFFTLRQQWTPAPKQRLEEIKKTSPAFHQLLVEFYRNKNVLAAQIQIVKKMVPIIFETETHKQS